MQVPNPIRAVHVDLESERHEAKNPCHLSFPGESISAVSIASEFRRWLDKQTDCSCRVLLHDTALATRDDSKRPHSGLYVIVVANKGPHEADSNDVHLHCIPLVAVIIAQRSTKLGKVHKEVDRCLASRIPHIWVVDTYSKFVVVRRFGEPPFLLNQSQEITAEPQLPGFKVAVSRLFD